MKSVFQTRLGVAREARKMRALNASILAAIAFTGFLSTAEAVVFFKDDFERTSLDKDNIGLANGRPQTQVSSWDYYKHTPVWTGGANGLEIQANGHNGFNAKSGKYRVELDTNANSSISTKINLVKGTTYYLKYSYRSNPKGGSGTTYTGGFTAQVTSASYSTPKVYAGDAVSWIDSNIPFVWNGESGEATLTFEATGASDAYGSVLDDISLETSIAGSTATVSMAESLKGILPPHVPGLTSNDSRRDDIVTPVVVDKKAAIALGKALFWDRAVGSDQMACASCHFNAGADNRIKNQFDPGIAHAGAASSTVFENTKSGNKSGPNYIPSQDDFPLDPNIDDIFGSSGTFSGAYKSSPSSQDEDTCDRSVNSIFHVNGVGTRNVEPRNTPTVINAAYNHRNFWDGRANNEFNGASPFGRRDTTAGVFINQTSGLVKKPLRLRNASLASQAVGPVGSDFEMACRARQFADVGRKLLPRVPLRSQTIAADDSVLSDTTVMPAGTTYEALVKKAFASAYWSGNCGTSCGTPGTGVTPSTPYSQMEANFSMYFGLSVQMYMETLVSDDAKFDKVKTGTSTFTAEESRGESVFNGQGKCSSCHNGPTMTSAALLQKNNNVIQGMLMQGGSKAVYDEGYYNTAVVPTAYDIGNGGVDPWNNPLSFSRQYLSGVFVDKFGVDSCTFEEASADLCSSNDSAAAKAGYRAAVDGAFKTSNLRNISLTGPYMHNGSMLTLEQVVDFYNRGGNFGTDKNRDKHPDITPLGLTAQQKSDLVAFMKTFTDDRVTYEKAPFDHPSLKIPHGHVGDQKAVTAGNSLFNGFGVDEIKSVPAVGKNGSSTALKPFEKLVKMEGNTAYYVDMMGRFGTINLSTGSRSVIGNTNSTIMSDVAIDSAGQAYGVAWNGLYRIDAATAATTFIGYGLYSTSALTAGPDGTLYGTDSSGNVYTLSTANGSGTLLGSIGVGAVGDMVFINNSLYITTYGNQIMRFDLTTRKKSVAVASVPMMSYGLTLTSNGTLYLSDYNNDIYKVNLSAGTVSAKVANSASLGIAISGLANSI